MLSPTPINMQLSDKRLIMEHKTHQIPAAIIGIGCIFAKSPDLKSFLHLLMQGINAISDPPDTHRYLRDYFDPDPKKADHIYCNRGGFLPKIAFDPSEFGIPPSALEATDTSQLLGLVVAKRALEDAGYGENGRSWDRSKASIILGVTGTQELVIPLGARLGHPIWRRALADAGVGEKMAEEVVQRIGQGYVAWQENSFPGLLGNVVAGRIANRLDLGGTNCVVDAACASSMSALHMSLLELNSGRADMVITGGVDTINDAFMHMCFSKTQILSASGDIRPFSQDADGTVLGEGIGMLVLKRLEDAEKDGDRIYAVIRGIGSASDGKSQSIYSPRQSGQTSALRRAYQNAGIAPESIEMVEAHGTGTRVGDQVEFKALCEVFGSVKSNGNGCALGSVKSNIGHTKAAAGTAGIIKAALSLYHKVLPPTLKAQPADPKLNVEKSPFHLNHSLRPWLNGRGHHRRAGVSAFGFGGSNFHTVLEEYESDKTGPSWDGSVEIAAYSAERMDAIEAQIGHWMQEITPESEKSDIARMAAQSRKRFKHSDPFRLVIVLPQVDGQNVLDACRSAMDKLKPDQVKQPAPENIFMGEGPANGSTAFIFPGQGSQYVGMGRDLICRFPGGLKALQDVDHALGAEHSLSEYIYPRLPGDAAAYENRLKKTDIAQPAIGVVSVAMLDILTYFGITPAATCGHSYGELVALHAAGCIDRETLWRLSIARGRLMADAGAGDTGSGSMLAVSAPLDELALMVQASSANVVIANRNSPHQGVLSGPTPAIEEMEGLCREKGWKAIRLPVAAAFHSAMMDKARGPFQARVDEIKWSSGPVNVMSNTLGGTYPADEREAKLALGGQLAQPVDFVANIEQLHDLGVRTFVEVGPKSVLSRLISATLGQRNHMVMALDRSAGREFGIVDLARVLARLAAAGHAVRFDRWENPVPEARAFRMRIPLSGANYRSPAAQRTRRPVTDSQSEKTIQSASTSVQPVPGATQPPPSAPMPSPLRGVSQGNPDEEKKSTPWGRNNGQVTMSMPNQQHLHDAFAVLQKGLASMQALQSQTTQAHQKYLESQTEANKTLREMVRSVQQWAAGALGAACDMPAAIETAGRQLNPVAVQPLPSSTQPATSDRLTSSFPSLPASPVVNPQTQPAPMPAIAARAPNDCGLNQIQSALLRIVGELTGYPLEMLGLEMDIEADLGIDSIKRVEILSSLEEKMPHLPKVTPDMVGTLKTLGQICAYLTSAGGAGLPGPGAQAPTGAPESAAKGDTALIQSALLRIVGELTGYPLEMLGLEMDIEADLGIDSIKRVEILSSLEEKMPHLPKVTPDMVGTLKTLGQICAYLTSAGGAGLPGPGAQAPTGAPESAAKGDTALIQSALLRIVGELTGYPLEMLGLEMDIEADLGIDSIKRVEILSSLEEKMPHLPKVTPDMVGTLKTLGQICAFLGGQNPHTDDAAAEKASPAAQAATVPDEDPEPLSMSRPIRSVLRIIPSPLDKAKELAPVAGTFIGVVTQDTHFGQAFTDALRERGIESRLLTQQKELDQNLSGLVLVAPLPSAEAILWAKAGAAHLQRSAARANAFFFTVTRLDGAFGLRGHDLSDPEQGALAGLSKTAALEWPGVICRALDLDPQWETKYAARNLADEIAFTGSDVAQEVGLGPDGRISLQLEQQESRAENALTLSEQDVVVVSGGGRGVTATAAVTLAAQCGCKLALLGRSPKPQAEPEWLAPLVDEAQVKQAILKHTLGSAPLSPKSLEKAYRQWMANREILATLERCAQKGIQAVYYALDVLDAEQTRSVIGCIRQELGGIKALIHGAGVLQDRLIVDKTAEQFQLVYDTKVKGLQALLAATEQDDLRYLVLFSSIAARMGNKGQADYAMANEALNKIALQQSRKRSPCKVLSLNWGPWDGGMVKAALRRAFIGNGVQLIPLQIGAESMVAEMCCAQEDVEVVIGGPLEGIAAAPLAQKALDRPLAAQALTQALKREIDSVHCPVLQSHQLGGRPVVPLALMTEWLAHGALHANPGLCLHGIDNLRLLKGITLEQQKRVIRLMAGHPKPKGEHFEVDVEIRDGGRNGDSVLHSSATAILTEQLPPAPFFKENGHFKTVLPTPPMDEIYNRMLFHGDALKGIEKIVSLSPGGITAKIRSAPSPDQWLQDPMRTRWIGDPLVLDCAFQMAIIWCYEQQKMVSLPSYAASYRQYRDRFPNDGVTAVLEIVSVTDRKLVGDFTFLDRQKVVIASLSGYEAIMDQGLFKAFGVKAA